MSTTTFAQKYWKDFELLSLEYIHDQYKDVSAQCIHTSFINDGGFDGSLTSTLTKEEAPFVHEILSLTEAKLRTDTNITIHDFAASIIAAYNFSAQILYVVSNVNFTEGTRKITSIFSNKVNLKIVLIDGIYLLDWINSKNVHPNNNIFISELIKSIKINNKNTFQDESANDCKNTSEFASAIFIDAPYLQNEELYGKHAQNIKTKIVRILERIDNLNRIVLLSGAVGTGKSTVISNVGYEMQQKNFIFNILDCDTEDALSVRSIFLWVLKSLWGIDPFKIYTNDNIAEFVDLVCLVANTPIEKNIKDTIREIFTLENSSYIFKSDLHTTYLLRYLNIILEKKHRNNRTILAIKNLHHLEQFTFDFMISLIQCLIQNNVGLIIELAPKEAKEDARNDWETGRNALCYFKKNGHLFELYDFEKEDALYYLSKNLPGLTDNYYNYILTHIGMKPVFLHYAVNWLILNEVVLYNSQKDYCTVAKPEEFFEGITPDQNQRIIEDIIRYYQSNTPKFQDIIIEIFEMIVLLDGSISYSIIEKIYQPMPIKGIIQTLLDTGLFMQTSIGISTNHELVFAALNNTSLSFYQLCAASKLYDAIRVIKDDEFVRCKSADLLVIMKQWRKFINLSIQISEDAFIIGEYNKCIKYLSLCRKIYHKLENKEGIYLLKIMYKELLAYEKMGRGGSAKKLFQDFQKQIQLEMNFTKKEPEKNILALEKLYLARQAGPENQYNFSLNMLTYAKQYYNEISEELYVSICFVFALIEKKYISLDSAVDFLKKEKCLLPHSIELDIHYQSHEAAKYLNYNPAKAISFYENIVNYSGTSKKYNKSIGHAYVDILNCYILLENWEDFQKQFQKVLEYLQTNVLYSEEGRLYNLDGLYYWLNGDLLTAKESFQNSLFYFGLVHNQMNGIITRINYIGLLISLVKFDDAILEFNVASSRIIKVFGVLFSQIGITKAYHRHREYVALLALIKYGNDLKQTVQTQKLISNISIEALPKHVAELMNGTYPDEVFFNTCIIHKDVITLTR